MKQLFLFFIICNSTFLNAQACLSSTSAIELRVNKVKATIRGAGSLWDPGGLFGNDSYVAPYPTHTNGNVVNAMYSGSVWIGGKDPNGDLKVAGQAFAHSNDRFDFWPGPIINNTTNTLECLKWDGHWEVFGSEIDAHKADLADNGILDNPIPSNLLEWPGRGNPNTFPLGSPLPLIDLAPFHDHNGDNIYNANDGDYPILGLDNKEYADQMIWWIFNDIGDTHKSGGPAVGVEVHALAYAFDTPLLEYTTFYKHTFINKGTTDLQDTYIGLWTDPQLGCFNDDFIGCDTARSLGISYNGEQLDSCANPQYPGYGSNIPYLGIDILRGPMSGSGCRPLTSFMKYFGSSGHPTGNPQDDDGYYNMMSGKWRNGDPIEYGGDGWQENTFPYPFMFPDNPASGVGWSECAENNNSHDTRMILGTGSFDFPIGGKNEFTIAVIFEPNVPHPCPDFQQIQTTSDQIQAEYDLWEGGSCLPPTSNETAIVPDELKAINLYPNPSDANETIVLENVPDNTQISLYSITGQLLSTIKQTTESGGTVAWQPSDYQLNAGLYLVKIQLEDKGSKILKLTISR